MDLGSSHLISIFALCFLKGVVTEMKKALKIALVLPSLSDSAPIKIAYFISIYLKDEADIEVFYLKKTINNLPFECKQTHLKFWKSFDFSGYDIIHSHLVFADWFVHRNRKSISGKTISTIHTYIKEDLNNVYRFPKNYLLELLWLTVLKSKQNVVYVSSSLQKYYTNTFRKSRNHVVYNGTILKTTGVDFEDFELCSLKKKYKILGTTSALLHRKGLQVIPEFISKNKDWYWVVFSDGNYKNSLQNLINKLGINDRCRFMGYRNDIQNYYPYFDVFVMPSYVEAFGLSICDAMEKKVPVVASNIPSFKELYTDKEVSFFETTCSKSLDHAIHYALQSKAFLVENAFHKYKNNFTAMVMANHYLALYKLVQKA